MKKVLIVAYGFPPVGGAGVQRPVKFVKYLRNFGWEPAVLTVENPSVPLIDETLAKDIPEGVKIHLARTMEPSYKLKQAAAKTTSNAGFSIKGLVKKAVAMLLIPDIQVLWWPGLFARLKSVVKAEQPACIFVTAPPFSSFIPVVVVGKLLDVPVILDYRDEWSFSRDNWENAVKTPLARMVDSWMERHVVKHAQAITVASPYYKASLEQMFPFAAGKIHTITNGYDPDDFAGIDFSANRSRNDATITIVYTGTVWRATSFAPFLEGVRMLAAKDQDITARIKLRIIGRIVAEETEIIEELKKLVRVETTNYLPHEEIFPEIVAADLLLLTLTDLPGAGKIIPGKTFEYLAAPIPVLALIPEGVTAEIVGHEKNVHVIQPGDAQKIAEILCQLVKQPAERAQREGIEKYGRPHLTKQLTNLIEMFV